MITKFFGRAILIVFIGNGYKSDPAIRATDCQPHVHIKVHGIGNLRLLVLLPLSLLF